MNTVLNDTSAQRSNRQSRGIMLKIDATDYNEGGVELYLNFGIKPALPPIAAQPSSGKIELR